MILVDTNVLIYAFDPGALHHAWAKDTLRKALLGEGAAVNPVILAEYLVGEQTPETAGARLHALGFSLLELPPAASLRCAQAYAAYLDNRRKDASAAPLPRTPLPDFFIGAHAALLDLPLATADTTRFSTYFPELRLIFPAVP